jgi:PIN domain nuclease of toxin-antitoxin system
LRLLLDTHIAIWLMTLDERLRRPARRLIASSDNQIFVSAVSLWEIAIKHALGRGDDAMPMPAWIAHRDFLAVGMTIVPVTAEHAVEVERLPSVHGDPFDRLLVAQAVAEPFRLVTHDKRLSAYGETVIVV